MRSAGGAVTRRQWYGFFALCAMGASSWLVDNAWPSTLPTAIRPVLDDLLMAIVIGAVGWKGLARGSLWSWDGVKLAVGSVLLLGVPATLAGVALGGASEVTITALFALAPITVVVFVSNFNLGGDEAAGANKLLGPALAGLGGTLLLLPVSTPESWREGGFAAIAALGVLIAAVAGDWMYRLLRDFDVIEAALICCFANGFYFLAVFAVSFLTAGGDGASRWDGVWTRDVLIVEIAKALLFNLPQIVLLVWLMRDVAPARFAARYLVVPLLTVVEGYVLLRPGIGVRAIGGGALMVFGVWRLLTASQREGEPGLVLR
jgi:drug/metabolite transporter (DMT)-like permease